mmetsp:Transcript_35756/g.46264  ORF Transcript_35756/g.46264 Transcript_35756/m.46264 type:complete len:243 (+) Transcript_35756:600-1328(+)
MFLRLDPRRLQQQGRTIDLRLLPQQLRLGSGPRPHQRSPRLGRAQFLRGIETDLVHVHGGPLSFDLGVLEELFLPVAFVLDAGFELLVRHGLRDAYPPQVELIERAVQCRGSVPSLLDGSAEETLDVLSLLEEFREGYLFGGDVFDGLLGAAEDDGTVIPGEFAVYFADLVFDEEEGEVDVDLEGEADGGVGRRGGEDAEGVERFEVGVGLVFDESFVGSDGVAALDVHLICVHGSRGLALG